MLVILVFFLSFPTRRSSDLNTLPFQLLPAKQNLVPQVAVPAHVPPRASTRDRKSTRLNSSHRTTSYAVFCLNKKQTPKVTSSTLYCVSLTLNAGNGTFLHCI